MNASGSMAAVYIMAPAKLFLLFISKEWTNIASSGGVEIWSKKVILLNKPW